LFSLACSNDQIDVSDALSPDRPSPLVVELNTGDGYRINPVTGDSIRPVVNSSGDTLITGLPIPIVGRVIDPGSVALPRVVQAGRPRKVPAHLNEHRIPDDLSTLPVQHIDLLESKSSKAEASSFVLINTTGDTLPTGIPVLVEGRTVPCLQPHPLETIPPGIKDNASIDIRYLDVYHGLISSQVISLMEDSQGNIWFGSTGGGAGRYDGKTLSHFDADKGFTGSWITAMIEDKHGRLWFGTVGEGVILFNGETFTHFSEKEGLSNNTINTILEDGKGNIWIGTTGGGVCLYDGRTFTHFTTKEGLNSNWILSILEDSMGNLWFGTQGGVCLYKGGIFRDLIAEGQIADYPVDAILQDRQGKLWFGTSGGGAIMFNGETYTYFTENEGLSSNRIETILEDRQGNLWFGTAGGGVSKYNNKTFTSFTTEEGLSGDWVISILEDSYGNLWFGTVGDGVSIINGQSFTHFTENEGLNSRAINSLMEDKQGNLWFGSMFGGVSMYNGESFNHFTEKEGLAHNTVETILEDRDGRLWFGNGAGGMSMYDGATFTHFTEEAGFSSRSVGSILEDSQGNLWFGTYGDGLIKYNGTFFTHFTEKEGLSNDLVESMLEDKQGNIWIGTLGGGVSMFDGETITYFTEKEGLSSNLIGSIIEDSQGRLWIGTMTGGACRYSDGNFTVFNKALGLSDNHIRSIVEDVSGNIWLGTDQGLDLIEFEPGKDAFHIFSFGLQDGLKGIHFLQNSVLLDSKNRLWWGSNRSLTHLDMNTFEIARYPPDIQLNRIEINGEFIDYRKLEEGLEDEIGFSSVAGYLNYPLNLELPYDNNHLSFHFSALDWTAPHKIRYSYRIEGLNERWSILSSEAKAEYRNLPYGTHTFEVKAIGEARIWSDSLEYTFIIRPPWWHRWWARGTYGILAILLVMGLVQWRTSRLKKRQKELENTVRERTVEISEKNAELRQKNENITDSIEYAKRIQTATLPPDEVLNELLPKHFIVYRPLQIVSGDFYWLAKKQEKIIVAVADCTGHGVPGAFMSMLGSALLNDIVGKQNISQANLVLNMLRDQVIASLRQSGKADEARDGMDITLCIIDRENMELQYAGAYNPLYYVREGKLMEIKADRMPIGISSEANLSFTNHRLNLQKDDTLYLFSDGYVDQIGGERRKKFMSSRFKTLLQEVQDINMAEQKAVLERTLNEWMGLTGLHKNEHEQIDDIVVMGIKVY